MIKTWFTESAAGVDITDYGITAVSISSSGLFGSERFVIDNIYHLARKPGETDTDLLTQIINYLHPKTPIVPVAFPAVCIKSKSNTTSAETVTTFQDTIKPLIEIGGRAWLDIDDILTADTGDVKRTIHTINHLNPIGALCPGAVSLLESLACLHSIAKTPDAFYIHARSSAYTLAAIINRTVHYCRTLYCSAADLPTVIDAAFKFLEVTHPGWLPTEIIWTGRSENLPLIAQQLPKIPVVEWSPSSTLSAGSTGNDKEPSVTKNPAPNNTELPPSHWGAAAGAAIAWMTKGTKSLLKDTHDRSTGGGVSITRRSALLVRSSASLFLLCLLAWLTAMVMTETSTVRQLKAAVRETALEQPQALLPGIKHFPPSSIEGYRNHTHLSAVAESAVRYGLIVNDVKVTQDRIDIQGLGPDLAGINGFSRDLARYFADKGATVGSPVTHRDLSDQPAFQLEIVWGEPR
ncbi:MAG: hypothetical protein WBM02_05425 [bacterium]